MALLLMNVGERNCRHSVQKEIRVGESCSGCRVPDMKIAGCELEARFDQVLTVAFDRVEDDPVTLVDKDDFAFVADIDVVLWAISQVVYAGCTDFVIRDGPLQIQWLSRHPRVASPPAVLPLAVDPYRRVRGCGLEIRVERLERVIVQVASRIYKEVASVSEQPKPKLVLMLMASAIRTCVEGKVKVANVLALTQKCDSRVGKHFRAQTLSGRQHVFEAQLSQVLRVCPYGFWIRVIESNLLAAVRHGGLLGIVESSCAESTVFRGSISDQASATTCLPLADSE